MDRLCHKACRWKLLKTHEMIYDSLIKKDIETLNAAIDEHYDIIEELLG